MMMKSWRWKMDYKQIVWLASYPKSGNTWVRLFLEAYYLGDEFNLNELATSLADDTTYRHQIGDGSNPKEYPVDIQQLTRPMALLRLVRMYEENKIEGLPLFVKTHNANMIANGLEALPEMLTKAIIFIVRDPRDVLPSFAAHMGCDIETAIKFMGDKYRVLMGAEQGKMANLISSWRMHTLSYLNNDTHNVKIFKYEDMQADPVRAFSQILEHAGVPVDVERVKKALDMVEISKLQKIEAEQGFNEASPKAKVGFFSGGGKIGWKGKITELQAKQIEKQNESIMKRLGYGNGSGSSKKSVKESRGGRGRAVSHSR